MQKIYLLTNDGYKDISDGIKEKTNCKEFLTELGNLFTLDNNLLIRTLDSSGEMIFKKVSDLKSEDILISEINNFVFSEDVKNEEKLFYLLGILYSFKIGKDNQRIILDKSYMTDYISEYFYRYLETDFSLDKYSLYISDFFIDKYNINSEIIPTFIFESNEINQKSFLKGFFDFNSIISEKMLLKDCYSSDFLQQISLMLKNLGIIVEIDNSCLIISGEEIINFYNIVGTYNQDLEEELLDIQLDETDFYQIFNIEDICYDYYKTTNKNLNFSQMNLNRRNIEEKLLVLEGDVDLKNKIKKLISKNLCFERIVAVSDVISKSLDINESEEYILNSFVIKK